MPIDKSCGNRVYLAGRDGGLRTLALGEIGTRLAARAKAFGMNIIGYEPFLPPYEVACTEFGICLTGLEKVLTQSDFVSLYVSLNDKTRTVA